MGQLILTMFRLFEKAEQSTPFGDYPKGSPKNPAIGVKIAFSIARSRSIGGMRLGPV
jgi:hypothetical protein